MKTRIKELREDNDLTQNQVSKYLNISQVAYSYYEINKRGLPIDILSKLADFYNTSTDYILYRTNIFKPYEKYTDSKLLNKNNKVKNLSLK